MIQQVRVIANFLKCLTINSRFLWHGFWKIEFFWGVRGSQFWVTVWEDDLVSTQQAFIICVYCCGC